MIALYFRFRSTSGLTTLIGVPGGVGDDLVEDVGELDLVLVARHVADVRRADDVVHREQRIASVSRSGSCSNTSTAAMPGPPGAQRRRPARPARSAARGWC